MVVTDTAQVTVSHTATQPVTVVQAEVQTSTIFSTITTTVSNEATQTDTEFVTVTSIVKREVLVVLDRRHVDAPPALGLRETLSHFFKRFSLPWTAVTRGGLLRRAEIAPGELASAISSATTATTTVTRTADVTSYIEATTTAISTSVVLTTILQTKTVVLNAQATVTTTSTLTVTSRPPTTITRTETATLPPTSRPSSSSSPSNSGSPSQSSSPPSDPQPKSSSRLSTGAIAGLAGGLGGAAVLALVGLLLFYLRRRRNRAANAHQDPSSYLEPYEPDMSTPLPQHRTSGHGVDRFSPSAPHHGTSPPPLAAGIGASSPPTSPLPADVDPMKRYSNMKHERYHSSTSPRLPPPGVAEFPAGQGNEVYEADGRPVVGEMDATGGHDPRAVEMDASNPVQLQHGRQPSGGDVGSPVSRAGGAYSPDEVGRGEDGGQGRESPNMLRSGRGGMGSYRDF